MAWMEWFGFGVVGAGALLVILWLGLAEGKKHKMHTETLHSVGIAGCRMKGRKTMDAEKSEMSAVEVLEWIAMNGDDESKLHKVFDDLYCDNYEDIFAMFPPQEIIDKITAYEADTEKPVEYGKMAYIQVYNPDTNGYGRCSKFEYWPGEHNESYEDMKKEYMERAARETGRIARIREIDACRVKKMPKHIDTDVEPVRHGHWEHTHTGNSYFTECYKCSCCDFEDTDGYGGKYCPNCGAKMDGGDADD